MGKLALRNPSVPASVVPIFRYDHTQIPNWIFEKFLLNHTRGLNELKVILYFYYLSEKTGDDEIVISGRELGVLLGIPQRSAQRALQMAIDDGILISKPSDIIVHGGKIPINAYKLIKPMNYKN